MAETSTSSTEHASEGDGGLDDQSPDMDDRASRARRSFVLAPCDCCDIMRMYTSLNMVAAIDLPLFSVHIAGAAECHARPVGLDLA